MRVESGSTPPRSVRLEKKDAEPIALIPVGSTHAITRENRRERERQRETDREGQTDRES